MIAHLICISFSAATLFPHTLWGGTFFNVIELL
jgi:hypothetical protein